MLNDASLQFWLLVFFVGAFFILSGLLDSFVSRLTSSVRRIGRDFEVHVLKEHELSKPERKEVAERFRVILCLGATVLILLATSSFLPREFRVVGIPVALFAAWFFGKYCDRLWRN